ncbi:SGNH/GDSL hydrolase family protein [Cyclobacterium marinum]|uniref:Putative hydrolase lipoprotein n=1 Tax=Cyclobacterium marinum (strain ATCC 25205 / DSM 745 / LMG 13164 / NCIMB 1802) TaxID=880070 RepID=G0J7S1_CYCMS|nr:SGNH/GDSL hydrolase family protein [Cyclobacterium marinum]AEL27769.1 putative hydrolase lipoprotein [Cyclobacterium marinum DSM 745]
MKLKMYLALALLFCHFSMLQAQDDLRWLNPLQNPDENFVHGQGWPGLDYHRLPDEAETKVRKAVWNLSRHAAGVKLKFNSDAEEIKVRYVVSSRQSMPHMPATGVSGLDLYIHDQYDWIWVRGSYSFGDTIQYTFPLKADKITAKDFDLYLPLYNEVTFLEIGVDKNASFNFISPSNEELPVVVYGTSIAQGACASRPGMAWTAILERMINKPMINLGFSGNGLLETPLIEYMASVNSSLYVLDCLPNLVRNTFTEEEVTKRIIAAVHALKAKKPETPILMVEHAGYTDEWVNDERKTAYQSRNNLSKNAYRLLIAEGIEELYYLEKDELGLTMDGTVDGTHPSDLGMDQHAKGYYSIVKEILD